MLKFDTGEVLVQEDLTAQVLKLTECHRMGSCSSSDLPLYLNVIVFVGFEVDCLINLTALCFLILYF